MAIQQIVTPWDQQPQEAAEIDWANPLAAHARALITCRLEHVSGSLATSVAGSPPDLAPGAAGLGLKFGGSSAVEFPGAKYVPPPLTVCFVANKSSSASDALISFGGAASGAGWQIQTAGVAVDGRITYGGVADYSPIGTLFSVGVDAVYHVTVSANTARFYRNGAFIGSCAVGTPNTPTKPLTLGAAWTGSAYANFSSSTIYGAQVFSRVLSDQEVAEHASNVWRLFQRREFVPTQQVGGGSIELSAAATTALASAAALTTSIRVATSTTATATATASMATGAQLGSAPAASLTASASLTTSVVAAAAAAASLTATASLTTSVRAAAAAVASLTASASLTTVPSGLATSASSSAVVASALTTAVRVQAAAAAAAAAASSLTTAVVLRANATAALVSTAGLNAATALAAAAIASAQASAALTTAIRLQALAAASASVSARVTVGAPNNDVVTAALQPTPVAAELADTGVFCEAVPWPFEVELRQ